MPIIKSAAKRMRQTATRTRLNATYKRRMREGVKQFNADVAAGKQKQAGENLSVAQKTIDKAAKKGVLNKNTASRRKSTLAKTYASAFGGKTKAKSTTTTKKAPAKKTTATKTAAKKSPAKKTTSKKTK